MPEEQKARHFESGAFVAWMLDVDGGYRGGRLREWSFEPVAKIPGGKPSIVGRRSSIDVHLLAENESLPQVTLEPMEDEKVLVRSSVALVVQGYGEPVAKPGERSVVVAYGSVLRAGPLLCAPLYAEQVESIHAGAMTLPFIGGGLEGDSGRESHHEVDPSHQKIAQRMGRNRILLALLLFVVLSALSVGLWLQLRPTIDPRRVLLVFDGWAQATVGPMHEQVERSLRDAGFDVVAQQGRQCSTDVSRVEELTECARSLLAGRIALVRIEVIGERPGLTEETPYLEVRATSSVFALLDEHSIQRQSVTFGGERPGGREAALADFGRDMVGVLSHGLRADLVTDTSAGLEFFTNVPPEQRRRVVQRRRSAERHFGLREAARRMYERSCERADEQVGSDRGPMKQVVVSGSCDEEYPIAVAPDGSWVLAQVETISPYFTFAESSSVRGGQAPERIDLIPADGGARRSLVSAQNFLGFGDVAAEVGKLYIVEKAQSRYGLVEVDIESGERRVVLVVEAPERITSPRVSADGEWVILWYRPRRGAEQVPRLLSTRDGRMRDLPAEVRGVEWVRLALPGRSGPETLLASIVGPLDVTSLEEDELAADPSTPVEELPPLVRFNHVVIIDPATGEVVRRIVDDSRNISTLVGVLGGELLYTLPVDSVSCELVLWNPLNQEQRVRPLTACPTHAVVTGSGIVARAQLSAEGDPANWDDEIVSIDPESGLMTALTANAINDRYVRGVSSARRIAFGRVIPTPHRHIPRAAVLIAEIPR